MVGQRSKRSRITIRNLETVWIWTWYWKMGSMDEINNRPEFGHRSNKSPKSNQKSSKSKNHHDHQGDMWWCPEIGHVQSPSTKSDGGKVQDKVQVQSPMWRESPGQSISSKSKVNQSERVKLANQVRAWAFGQVYKPSDQKACQRCWGSGLESLLKSDWIASKNEDKD